MISPKQLQVHLANLAQLPAAFVTSIRQEGLRTALLKAARFRFVGPYRYVPDYDALSMSAEIERWPQQPLITVVLPVYNVPGRWLRRAIASVQNQVYPNWELCIVDDKSTRADTRRCLDRIAHPRIRVRRLDANRGISGASNEALSMATGEYVTFLDHDDELTADALFEVACVIKREAPDVIYSDEDLVQPNGTYLAAHLKPDYAPDFLFAHNYITHLMVVRRELVDGAGGFRDAFNGAQDYDLMLRLVEQAKSICHVRKVLYHWRSISTSTSRSAEAKPYTADAGERALQEALERRNIDARIEHGNLANYFTVRRRVSISPLVSIIIPFRDKPDLLATCVSSVLGQSTYTNLEIICANNDSKERATQVALASLQERDSRVRVQNIPGPFNYSAINNETVRHAKGEYLVLMNNDIEIITPDWIEALLEHAQRPEVGAVGAKLYYANGNIQHAGVIVGIAGFAGHAHRHFPGYYTGYMNRLCTAHNVSAVTAALLMVSRPVYLEMNGLDEEHLGTALNDIDFCLRLREKGYLNVFTPHCEAYHYESSSRGYEDTPEKQARMAREVAWFQERHAEILKSGDPYYNPGLTYEDEGFSYRPNGKRHGARYQVTKL